MKKPKDFRSGFVSILGRPNTGKSTLLNALLGTKIAIVSDKPQTTRTTIQGVLHMPGAQVIFLDTPGIHRPDTTLNKRMMAQVQEALEGRDLLLFLVDASKKISAEDEQAMAILRGVKTPVLLLLNKIDRFRDKSQLLPLIEQCQKLGAFEEFLPISALTGDGLDDLRKTVLARLPKGPRFFPENHITDQPERFFAAELIREKVLLLTREEVPHSVMVQVEEWEESDRLLRLGASIVVERSGHKAIVIGAGGQKLKQIGIDARVELERLLGRKIFLKLFVKVRQKWRENPAYLAELDWKHQ